MTDTAATMLRVSAKDASFKWETCHTLGMKIKAASNIPPDTPNSLVSTGKRLKRRVGFPTKQNASVKVEKIVTVPKMPSKAKQYRLEFGHYIQHVGFSLHIMLQPTAEVTSGLGDGCYLRFYIHDLSVWPLRTNWLEGSGLSDLISIWCH